MASLTPIFRHTSATVTPVSAWRRTNTIWASVNLFFFRVLTGVLRYDKYPIFFPLRRPSLLGGGHIGTTPESLSRILSEFRQDESIELTPNFIKVLQPDKLRRSNW
ncbi:MAG: helix-turn-helix domain-containing protein [Hymenobacter sp.]|nr:MAG: helix-turn-helix domain-containing protein [Hymenobacter sp.]